MNNHVGRKDILIVLALDKARGGSGPTLLSYNKSTEEITKRLPLFPSDHPLSNANAAGWYFSATLPTALYLNDGPAMVRYDVITHVSQVIFDVSSHFGDDREILHISSSDDDHVHAATLKVSSTGEELGCLVYYEVAPRFLFFGKFGKYDQCRIDRSGRYVTILEDLDEKYGLDNRFVELSTGSEERVMNGPGRGAISPYDSGFGYVVGQSSYTPFPNAMLTKHLGPPLVDGPVVHYNNNWGLAQVQHISHTNAQQGLPKEQQYACGSNADRARNAQNEILCFRLDGSLVQLVVAPVMTNMDAFGGGNDGNKTPKGNLDVTGQFYIWTTNLGTSRLDAFIVKVPGHLLL